MAKIYLIRHAESVANTQGIFQGQSYDTALSPLGIRQAAALARRFAGEKFDAVYSSPLKRTFQTAESLDVPHIEADIIETNHGAWEGRSKAEIQSRWPDLYTTWLTTPSKVIFPQGEEFVDTHNRVIDWFNHVAATNQTVAAVTHSNVIMSLITHLRGEPLDVMWQYAMQPTSVTLIESHSPTRVIYINDTSHLNGLESDMLVQAI